MQMICRAQIQSWICFISAISVRSSFLFWQQGNKNPNTRKSTLRRFALTSTPQSNQYIDTLYNKPQETGLEFFVIIFVINKLPCKTQSFLLFLLTRCTTKNRIFFRAQLWYSFHNLSQVEVSHLEQFCTKLSVAPI